MMVLVLVLVVVVVIVFVVVVVVVPTRCLSLVRILFWASRVVSEAQGGRELEEKRREGALTAARTQQQETGQDM